MRIPDWVVYAVVLVVIVGTLFSSGSGDKDKSWVFREEAVQSEPEFSGRGRTPAASDSDALTPRSFNDEEGLPLPDSDPFDERVLVQVGDAEDGIGTAFAINQSGAWLTARHDHLAEVAGRAIIDPPLRSRGEFLGVIDDVIAELEGIRRSLR